LKKGDKVIVRKDVWGGHGFHGHVAVIVEVSKTAYTGPTYGLEFDPKISSGVWWFTPGEIRLLSGLELAALKAKEKV
jgi:hypothetical protein